MKNTWIRPQTTVQQFNANEYVAACGWNPVTGKYIFKCDAPAGYWNGNPLKRFHPCPETHETDSRSDFGEGWIDSNYNLKHDPGEDVITWAGQHATKNLDRSIWEEKVENS